MTNRAERRQIEKLARKAPPRRTYALKLTGELDGFHVVMGAMTGADVIALRSGQMSDTDAVRIVAGRIVEHDFDIDDPLNLDFWILSAILRAWGTALEDAVVPPVTGER